MRSEAIAEPSEEWRQPDAVDSSIGFANHEELAARLDRVLDHVGGWRRRFPARAPQQAPLLRRIHAD